MGGVFNKIFSTPKIQQPVIPVVDTQVEAQNNTEQEKQENIARQRRGQEGTIRTSYNGILGEKEDNLKRKNLLGE